MKEKINFTFPVYSHVIPKATLSTIWVFFDRSHDTDVWCSGIEHSWIPLKELGEIPRHDANISLHNEHRRTFCEQDQT